MLIAMHFGEQLAKDVAELSALASQATRQRSKDVLAIEIRRLNTELATLRSQLPSPTAPAPTASAATAAPTTRYQSELTQYAFDQSDKFVKLFVTLDGVEKSAEDNVRVVFTESTITLTVLDLHNKDYQLKINNLLHPIDVDRSHRKLKPGMVVIYAKKTSDGKNMHNRLTGIGLSTNDLCKHTTRRSHVVGSDAN